MSDATVMNIAVREPTSVNLASLAGVTATAGKEALAASYAVDADATTRWGSEGGSATQHWITVDLQKRFSISTIKLSWETACSKNYYLKASLDGTHFYPVGHYTTAPSTGGSGASVYTTYAIESGVEARYLQMYSLENNTGYGTSIWEFEAYGACASNGTIPIMTFADVHNISLSNSGATVALEVGAWDDATAFDDLTYKVVFIAGKSETLNNQAATDGVLSLSSLTIGTTYTVRIYAIDGSDNESANYKEVTFTPYVNLYYFTNDLTGTDPVAGWADALNNASNAAARRFSTTAQDGI
ncbi:MAG: discoidin domain-containing protein, partial [Paludibacteraceae bacterium]|nr:discoidin domain-containing protein [Paludibacteraceae bacterium]